MRKSISRMKILVLFIILFGFMILLLGEPYYHNGGKGAELEPIPRTNGRDFPFGIMGSTWNPEISFNDASEVDLPCTGNENSIDDIFYNMKHHNILSHTTIEYNQKKTQIYNPLLEKLSELKTMHNLDHPTSLI